MKKIVLVLVAAGVVAAWPASSGAATFKGVVVGKERGAVLVASPSGVVRAALGRARVGARVAVAGSRLRIVGSAHNVRLRGVVVRRLGATVFLASNHHLVAMRAAQQAASPAQPGQVVVAKVSIENGQLEENENEVEEVGEERSVQVQALVTAVAPGLLTVTVNGQALQIRLPAALTLPQSLVGQMVTVTLRVEDENDNDDNDAADNNQAPPATSVVVVGGGGGDDHGGSGHGGDDGGGHDGGGDHGGGDDDGGGDH